MFLKIALLQLLPGNGLEEQLELGKAACKRAKDMGADIALFPEMWSSGYLIPQDEAVIQKLSISSNSDFIQGFCNLAAKLQLVLHFLRDMIRNR